MMISTPRPNAQANPSQSVYELVSYETMQPHIEALTAIEPYSGWRNAGTVGEQEATDYLEAQLADLNFLTEAGMTVEQQAFPIYATQEIWDAQLEVVVEGTSIIVPTESPRGDLNRADKLMQFDTNGA